jgi:uncharacterized membrane protein
LINFDICGFIGVMIVVHNTMEFKLHEKFFTLITELRRQKLREKLHFWPKNHGQAKGGGGGRP